MSRPLKVFISYAHRDTESKHKLIAALDILVSEGVIEIWDDSKLKPGIQWRDAIASNLADSDILLYLVSADSLASEYQNRELSDALPNKHIRVIPVILERCDWLNHQLSDFQALPKSGKPIKEWESESAGWEDAAKGIRKLVDKMQSQTDLSSDTSQDELRAELALQRGNFLTMVGQLDAAIVAYSGSLALYPRYGAAYNNRGMAYADIGDLDIAIMDYTKAIELNPNHAVAYNNRGIISFKKDELDNALADFTKAIELQPDFAMAYENRAKVWLIRQELEKAVVDLASARAKSIV